MFLKGLIVTGLGVVLLAPFTCVAACSLCAKDVSLLTVERVAAEFLFAVVVRLTFVTGLVVVAAVELGFPVCCLLFVTGLVVVAATKLDFPVCCLMFVKGLVVVVAAKLGFPPWFVAGLTLGFTVVTLCMLASFVAD